MNLKEIVAEAFDQQDEMVVESVSRKNIPQIFNDEKLTFGEIRNMLKQLFQGGTDIWEQVDGVNMGVTYKNGKFMFAPNQKSIKDPLDYEKVVKCFEGDNKVKEAFVNSSNALGKALQAIDTRNLNRIFANGQNFLNVDIVYPPLQRVVDYGNKCLIQLGNVDVYDDKFHKVTEDKVATSSIYKMLKEHDALQQEMFEITQPTILKIKNGVDSEQALNELLSEVEKLVDGIGYRSTIQDYVNDRLSRYIVNSAMKLGMDVSMNSDFVNELANRISYVSHKRPTKTDLICYAKKDGIDTHSEAYRNLIQFMEDHSDSTNDGIMKPIEHLIMKASMLLFKSLVGFMSADPNKNAQKIVHDLDETISTVNEDETKLTPEILKRFHKNLEAIEGYQDGNVFPSGGIVFNFKNKDGITRTYKMTGNFGQVSSLLNILKK